MMPASPSSPTRTKNATSLSTWPFVARQLAPSASIASVAGVDDVVLRELEAQGHEGAQHEQRERAEKEGRPELGADVVDPAREQRDVGERVHPQVAHQIAPAGPSREDEDPASRSRRAGSVVPIIFPNQGRPRRSRRRAALSSAPPRAAASRRPPRRTRPAPTGAPSPRATPRRPPCPRGDLVQHHRGPARADARDERREDQHRPVHPPTSRSLLERAPGSQGTGGPPPPPPVAPCAGSSAAPGGRYGSNSSMPTQATP